MKMSPLGWVAFVLVIIGGLNWGLIGFFSFDLVKSILGDMTVYSRIVYSLVGVAALALAIGATVSNSEEE